MIEITLVLMLTFNNGKDVQRQFVVPSIEVCLDTAKKFLSMHNDHPEVLVASAGCISGPPEKPEEGLKKKDDI